MSYPNTNPAAATLLADKNWRRRHSLWLLAPILGMGMLSFIGFLYVAIRVQSKKFWVAAVIGSLGSASVWTALALTGDLEEPSTAGASSGSADTSTTESMSDLGFGVVAAVWVALIVYAVILNRDYLRFRAGMFESKAWYHQHQATGVGQQVPQDASPPQAYVPGFLGIDQNDYYSRPQPAATPPPPPPPPLHRSSPPAPPAKVPHTRHESTPIDVNSASASDLSAGLGIDSALAARVVAVRDSRGGYATLDDLVSAAGLQPHELLRFQGRVSFRSEARFAATHDQSAPPTPKQDRPSGRIIDI